MEHTTRPARPRGPWLRALVAADDFAARILPYLAKADVLSDEPSAEQLALIAQARQRILIATLYLQEWAAAVQLRAAGLHGLTRALIERQRVAG